MHCIFRYETFMFPKALRTPDVVLDYQTHYSDLVKAKSTAGIIGGKVTHGPRGSSARNAKAGGYALRLVITCISMYYITKFLLHCTALS